jgi:hypothetical protein
VLICLGIEVLIGPVLLGLGQISPPLGWVIYVLACPRIVEIIGRTVDVTDVSSVPRTLALAVINYIELALCFGMIYALNYHCLSGAGAEQPITGFYFSIITQLTIGYGDVHPLWLRLVVALQGLLTAVFVIFVLARAAAALPITDARTKTKNEQPPPHIFSLAKTLHSCPIRLGKR